VVCGALAPLAARQAVGRPVQVIELDRPVVEAAAAYMADEDTGIGFLYSGWCQAALPHRKLPNDQGWQLDVERVRLIVELRT
jgi:hypothetical protein